jgi:hypothetical protein
VECSWLIDIPPRAGYQQTLGTYCNSDQIPRQRSTISP